MISGITSYDTGGKRCKTQSIARTEIRDGGLWREEALHQKQRMRARWERGPPECAQEGGGEALSRSPPTSKQKMFESDQRGYVITYVHTSMIDRRVCVTDVVETSGYESWLHIRKCSLF